jgi:hypothetical protein
MGRESFMGGEKLFCRTPPQRRQRAGKQKGRLAPAFFLTT